MSLLDSWTRDLHEHRRQEGVDRVLAFSEEKLKG
jgi:hypothetical protein